MNKYIIERVIKESNYLINTKKTIREIAKYFNISKSTVHKDISKRLLELDKSLYAKTLPILKEHIDTRHIKGGESTRKKFMLKNLT